MFCVLGTLCPGSKIFTITYIVSYVQEVLVMRETVTYHIHHFLDRLVDHSYEHIWISPYWQAIFSQNGKNEVSTRLCDRSQPINFVWYIQFTFFLDAVFRHVYQLVSSVMLFWNFFTSYICTQIKINQNISRFSLYV